MVAITKPVVHFLSGKNSVSPMYRITLACDGVAGGPAFEFEGAPVLEDFSRAGLLVRKLYEKEDSAGVHIDPVS
jgi:hypothetical protein